MPQAYQMYGKEGDKRYYSKMQTYIVFVLCWMGLGLSLFGKELIEIFALNHDYWPAHEIIPIIVLAYIFNGARTAVSVAMYLKKKTQYIAFAFIVTAIFNIGLNFALIPMFGRLGAAYATLISFFVLYLISYVLSNRVYRIQYENLKFFKMVALVISLYTISLLTSDMGILIKTTLKISIVAVFPVVLFFLNFYERVELERIKEGVNKFLRRIN
jgi:O-antigen/teichoic acid export membrane protein